MHIFEILGPLIIFVICTFIGWYLNVWAEIGAIGSGLPAGLISGSFKVFLVISFVVLGFALYQRWSGWVMAVGFLPLFGGLGSWAALPFLGYFLER